MMLSSKGRNRAFTATFGGIVTMLSAAVASAQTETPAPEEDPAPPAVEPAPAAGSLSFGANATTEGATAEAEAETPTPAEPVAEEPAFAPAAPEAPVDAPAVEGEAPAAGKASLFVFGDAWAGFQSAKSGSEFGGDVYATNGPDGTPQSGFGLSWLGADIAYDAGKWALNASLRFGDGVHIYGTGSLGPITNAYVTWRPAERLSLSVGSFGTIYGAEVAESWQNLNYTRGEVYMNLQPFWHTGLRAEYEADSFVARALVVNEANSSVLGQGAVNVGGQVGYVSDAFSLYGGVLQSLAPETSLNYGSPFATFVDVVAVAQFGDFTFVGNFDYNAGYKEVLSYAGGSLAAGYAITKQFGIAARGEYITWEAPEGDEDPNLTTGTITFDVKPVKDVDNFVVRLDGRIEHANMPAYNKLSGDTLSKDWYSATLGFVGFADLL